MDFRIDGTAEAVPLHQNPGLKIETWGTRFNCGTGLDKSAGSAA